MTHDVIATCPVCEQELSVTRLQCRACGTTLEGDFRVGRFGRLGRDQMDLLEAFLRSRGNLREMERESGLSYPTLRNRVDALIRALDLGDPPAVDGPEEAAAAESPVRAPAPAAAPDRQQVLERLARHELTAGEAARLLRPVSGPRER